MEATMRKSAIIDILARRLGVAPARIGHIAARLADAGRLSKATGSRRFPPDLGEHEVVRLALAVMTDSGLGDVVRNVEFFSTLRGPAGRFDTMLADILFGPPRSVRHLIIRHQPPGVSMVVDGEHVQFGLPASDGGSQDARIISGSALAAIAAELRGLSAGQADAVAAASRIINGGPAWT
jgi:hypothetical protein